MPVKTYTTADGLPRNSIECIYSDSRGYLWFCTPEGLSRFDGYQFTNYDQSQGLAHAAVYQIIETRRGAYWVGSKLGLCRFIPNPPPTSKSKFTCYRPGASALAAAVITLLQDSSGKIWVGTRDGLYQFMEGDAPESTPQFSLVETGMPNEIYGDRVVTALVEDHHRTLWILTEHSGIYRRWTDGRVERYTQRDGLPPTRITSLAEDAQGNILAGTWMGLLQIGADPNPGHTLRIRLYTQKDGLPARSVTSILPLPDGQLWLSLQGGLSRLEPRGTPGVRFESWTTANGLSDANLSALALDVEGNLWVGTEGSGVMKITLNGFSTYTVADGLGADADSSMLEDSAGRMVAAAAQEHGWILSVFDSGRFTNFRPALPQIRRMGWGWNQVVLRDRQGGWWFASYEGIYRFPPVKSAQDLAHTPPAALYTRRNGLPSDAVFRLFEDSAGDMWIAAQWEPPTKTDTLTRWDRATGTFHRYTQLEGRFAVATAFREDQAGDLWIGFFQRGLARYRQGQFAFFGPAQGVPVELIGDLHLDRAGRLWAASLGGLIRIDQPAAEHPRIQVYTAAQGLSSSSIKCITEDRWGRIYVATGRGVDRLDPVSGSIRRYTSADGLPAADFGEAYCDRQGGLWFASSRGLLHLVPEQDAPHPPGQTLVSGIRARGVTGPVSDLGAAAVRGLVFGPSQNQIEFQFLALNFASGQQLRYQYRLEGADRDWSPPSAARSVNYESISPGNHRFLVRAVNSDGAPSSQPALVEFRVVAPVWQRWWFELLAVAIGAAVIYKVYRYRVAHLIELERVRTRIATDLHDDMGASLSQISILSELARKNSSPQTLADIAEIARRMAGDMSDIVWAISPRHDRFDGLVHRMRRFAGDTLNGRNIALSFETARVAGDSAVPLEIRRPLYLVFKEAVNNVARHSSASRADVRLELDGDSLKLVVEDDGRGFDPQKRHEGEGLGRIARRVRQIGGSALWDSRPGSGTRFTAVLPLHPRASLHKDTGRLATNRR